MENGMGSNAVTGGGNLSTPEDDGSVARLQQLLMSLPAEDVEKFHLKSDLDVRNESQHHTLGLGPTQAASGAHTHMDGNGMPILTGRTITGSTGGNSALQSVISILVDMGAVDGTT